ncbi:hypothetical protein ACMA1D_05580 [Streptomyces sp. 796.1]|uniref:hypothetical protein n=1 Tax=Streptomyces sp. 796.1 TaxID=3163029 RepID=UPI0039C8E396
MIAVLTSGVALGAHVPGVRLAQRLRERGADVVVDVLERWLPADRLAAVVDSRRRFQRNLRFAVAAQGLATDPVDDLTPEAVAALEAHWTEQEVDTFVVFSGFWLRLLDSYLTRRPTRTIACHVDAVISPSYRRAGRYAPGAEHVWLARADGTLPWTIPVDPRPPLPWAARGDRLLVHGGGWAIGSYRDRARQLTDAALPLDLIVPQASAAIDGARCFTLDPDWHPWHDDGLPPLLPVPTNTASPGHTGTSAGAAASPHTGPSTIAATSPSTGTPTTPPRTATPADAATPATSTAPTVPGGAAPAGPGTQGRHLPYELARSARAIVSKPGGGTLLDSLWTATPLVLLEPAGSHEAANGKLWRQLGFALSYDEWSACGFAPERLEPLHRALLGAARPRNLLDALLTRETEAKVEHP